MSKVVSFDNNGNLIDGAKTFEEVETKEQDDSAWPKPIFDNNCYKPGDLGRNKHYDRINILIENGTPSGYDHDDRVSDLDFINPDRILSYDGRDLIHLDQTMVERDAFKNLQDQISMLLENHNINLVAFAGFGPINLLRRAGLYSLAEWIITEGVPVLFMK